MLRDDDDVDEGATGGAGHLFSTLVEDLAARIGVELASGSDLKLKSILQKIESIYELLYYT